MASYNWTTATSGDWNTGTLWSGGTPPNLVPNAIDANATIDVASATTLYTVTIAPTESITLASLDLNKQGDGTNSSPYKGAVLEMDGTLTFTGSGTIGGSLQSQILSNGGTFVNVGNLASFTQGSGTVLFEGSNPFYVQNELQSLGTVIVDTGSIGELIQNTLTDGIYSAVGDTSVVDLGGTRGRLIPGITKIQGPPDQTTQFGFQGWTELQMNGPAAAINEWNGTAYVSVETTLNDVGGGGLLEALTGRGYTTANAMTLESRSLMWVQGGTTSINGGLVLSTGTNSAIGGVFEGFGTITNGVTNNGTMVALGGTLDIVGALTGTGVVQFDKNYENFIQFGPTQGAIVTSPTGAVLQVGTVSAGQTIVMNGDDTLLISSPSNFAGTIMAGVGDRFVLQGVAATSAVLKGNTLAVFNGTQTVASLALAGSYTNEHVDVVGSGLVIAADAAGPPSGTKEFDATYYLQQYPDVAASGMDPLTHYEKFGWKEGRNPDPFFNTKYYLNQNPDVAAAGIDPLAHYEEVGWKEGRDPSISFSTNAYLAANPDVTAAKIDPLLHYLEFGKSEGRMAFISQPHGTGAHDPLVDNKYYFSQNPDVAASGADPTAHYKTYGWLEGRNPDALFDTKYYLQQNPDVKAAGIDPLMHFEDFGWKEGRDPSAEFSTSQYLAANRDVAAAGLDPLVHYEQYGILEGRAIYHV